MLYDPKWQVKADPFSLDSLIAWLETKPAGASYDYMCNCNCLLAQYFAQAGFLNVEASGFHFYHAGGEHGLPKHFNEIAVNSPWLYGAALARAKQVVA